MKKIFFAGLIIVLGLSACDLMNGEFNPRNVSVSEAKNLRDGVYVRVTGDITRQLFHEWYVFTDNTGSITVEIENEVWARNGINPTTLVLPAAFEIVGEVDKERNQETIIEVERLRKL